MCLFLLTRTKYLRPGNFIRKRGLFNSQFWRFKAESLGSGEGLMIVGITMAEEGMEEPDHMVRHIAGMGLG